LFYPRFGFTETMKPLLHYLSPIVLSLLLTTPRLASADSIGVGPSFKGPIGLQLYSLRTQFATNVPGTLDLVKRLGFTDVELAGTYKLTPEQFRTELDLRGLKAVSAHFPFDRFRTNVDGIIREAKILGLKYVGCAWIPHGNTFDEKTCRDAIEVFNRAGKALAAEGMVFFSHTHGYEFTPFKDGTFFDLMMTGTNPKFVSFQMDMFWVVHAGVDPVKLMDKYGSRWQLMHLKGMREGTPVGLFTGHSDVTNDVPIGQGMVSFPPLLQAAAKAGVKWYFIEDESPAPLEQIPQSLHYLETVKW
jgi:sugar phosphate isomerase/epimerase